MATSGTTPPSDARGHMDTNDTTNPHESKLLAAIERLTAACDRLAVIADRQARLLDRRVAQQAAEAVDGLARITRFPNGSVEVRVADPAQAAKAAVAVVAQATRPAGDDEWGTY